MNASPPSDEMVELQPKSNEREALLVELLRENDVACPLCGYNLRGLTKATCPECKQALELTVGMRHLRMGWFLLAITPGMFSGIAAVLLTTVLLIALILEGTSGGGPPYSIYATVAFGWASGVFAVLLAFRRQRFLIMTPTKQRFCAILIWVIHIGWFAMFILLAIFGW